ncbi:hypothetical protein B0H13DRAFT_2486632 [Mycena leptocephala]|nr:hypothetical protein B0H13DRAFT_2486632 [Mycena leptocephala]
MSSGRCKPQIPAMVSGSSHKAMRQSEFCTPGGLDGYESLHTTLTCLDSGIGDQPMRPAFRTDGWMALECAYAADIGVYNKYEKPQAPSENGWRGQSGRHTTAIRCRVPARPVGRGQTRRGRTARAQRDGDPLNQKQRDKAQPSVRFRGSRQRARLWKKKGKTEINMLVLHVGWDRRTSGAGTTVREKRPLSLGYVGAALHTRALPARQAISQWQQRHRPRVALVDVPGADELGSAITLPQIKPDADLDVDEPDTDNEGTDEAKERLVGVAAAVWSCFTRAWWRRLRRGRRSGETGRRRCGYGRGAREGAISIGGGSGQDWSEGRSDERTGDFFEGTHRITTHAAQMGISMLSLPLGVLLARRNKKMREEKKKGNKRNTATDCAGPRSPALKSPRCPRISFSSLFPSIVLAMHCPWYPRSDFAREPPLFVTCCPNKRARVDTALMLPWAFASVDHLPQPVKHRIGAGIFPSWVLPRIFSLYFVPALFLV